MVLCWLRQSERVEHRSFVSVTIQLYVQISARFFTRFQSGLSVQVTIEA